MNRCYLAALLSVLMLCVSAGASAQPEGVDETLGRKLASEAMTFYKNGDYTAALEKFDEARAVYPAAQVLRLRGYTLLALERWLQAADALDEALESTYKPLLPRDQEHAQDNMKVVLSHLVVLKVSSKVVGATVSIDDGEAQPLPFEGRIAPGEYTLLVEADGYDSTTVHKSFEAGATPELTIDPKKVVAPPKPKPKPVVAPPVSEPDASPYGWFPHQGVVGLSVAGAGIVAAGVALAAGVYGTQLRASVQQNIDIHQQNYNAQCDTHTDLCLADIALINHDGERAHNMQQVGLYTGIGGGVLLAAGVTLWLFADDGPLADPTPADAATADEKRARLSCAPALPVGAQPWQAGMLCAGQF
ncbi:MAG TPA: PEGA domain-containing protein [Sorangium sp.]|nr:PEGA domain-containing protein [Sorangium sp.]